MKKKQMISVIIAAVLFIVIGLTGVLSAVAGNLFSKSMSQVSSMGGYPMKDYIGVVKIEGTILYSTSPNTSFTNKNSYDHDAIKKYIKDMSEDEFNKGILLFVNSGGGSAFAGDDLYLELMDYKEKTGRPIYAYFDSIACSAAYDLSMAADEIYANRMTTTGAIGVYSTYYDLSQLFEKYGIREVLIKSGENKGMGSYGQEFTDEQIALVQEEIDEMYDIFITNVANGRKMDKAAVKKLADGRTFTASQALDNGLIDGICRYDEYKEMVEGYFTDKITFYEKDLSNSAFSSLMGSFKQPVEKTEEELLFELIEVNKNRGGAYESSYR